MAMLVYRRVVLDEWIMDGWYPKNPFKIAMAVHQITMTMLGWIRWRMVIH